MAGAVEEDAAKTEARRILHLEAGQALPVLQGPLGQGHQTVAPARLAGSPDADLLCGDDELVSLLGEGGLDQVDLGVVILGQGEPRQLVEMGQQGGQGDRAADMGPLGQAEVALRQPQLSRLGHYAVGGLHLG
ncbi:hypothetical protein D3C84_672900 [compost metagenome]